MHVDCKTPRIYIAFLLEGFHLATDHHARHSKLEYRLGLSRAILPNLYEAIEYNKRSGCKASPSRELTPLCNSI